MDRPTTSTRKKRNYKEKAKIYATSAAGSVAVEGAEESSTAALVGGIEETGAEVEEAAEEVIRDTMPGAYSFAFLKNPSISERGRARESQSFPSPPFCHATEQGKLPFRHPISPTCVSL
jgi:hypothetical protein